MQILCDLKDYIAQKELPTYGQRKIYATDFANIDISYCVMNKIIKISVINRDHRLSINPERVPKLTETWQFLAPPEIDEEHTSDSDIGHSPEKGSINRSSIKRKSLQSQRQMALFIIKIYGR